MCSIFPYTKNSSGSSWGAILLVLIALTLCAGTGLFAADPAEESEEPVNVKLTEKVEVHLAEVQILLTDKRGNPITDLKRNEIHVFENGEEKKIAFLETVRGIRDLAPVAKIAKKKLEIWFLMN